MHPSFPKSWCFRVLPVLILPGLLYGQGHFLPSNRYGSLVDAPVYDALGHSLAGNNYLAEIYGSSAPGSLTPLVQLGYGNTRLIMPFMTDGYFRGSGAGFLSVLNIPPNGWAWLQVRAWDASLGATYEEVATLGLGGYGESPLFYAQGGDPFDQFPTPAPLIGLQSFTLRPIIPEPSASALLAVGVVAWWMVRRQRGVFGRGDVL